jgi:galactose mutarotase-like enzyme
MNEQVFQLSAHNKHIKIKALGAELVCLQKTDKKNLLWEKTSSHWNRVAPILFPIVGKLKDDHYTFQGEGFQLTQHGFLRDQVFTLLEQTDSSITLEFLSNTQTVSVYPFKFSFQICYSLDEIGLRIEAKVKNLGKSEMYFSYGGHPAFYLEDSLENYSLHFKDDIQLSRHLIENGLYTGATQRIETSRTLKMKEELFLADAIVFKEPIFQEIELVHNTKGPILSMECESWTAIGIWTKSGAPFLCLEPWWGYADSINSEGDLKKKPGIRKLKSGMLDILTYRINPS